MPTWAAAVLLSPIVTTAQADVTPTDLQIAARALSFMEKPPSGNIRLGIIYIPGDDHSIREADSVAKLLGSGLRAGNLEFIPVLVGIDAAVSAPVDLFFIPEGIGDRAREVSSATAARKLACITVDITQVEDGRCVLGVRALPKVRIYINRAAAVNSGTSFVSVFRMMVTEF
jgi:hypothetical protein